MNKDDGYYILHILMYARKISALLENQTRETFDENELMRVTVTHWLQIIGEAASHISDKFQETHTNISWRPIVGMRNRIVHDYLGIDDEIIWATATIRIPELIEQLQQMVDSIQE
jgi:uncharacterized protein with HEPN domain